MSAIKIRIMYRNLWRTGLIYQKSSEHPQWPTTDTQIDTPVMAWRTRYGTGSGNGDFAVDATCNKIDFDDGAGELTATLNNGYYNGLTLAAEIQTKLRYYGTKLYTCTYSEPSGLFNISSPSGTFNIRWNNGTHKTTDISGLCGYNDAANDTGALSYVSDYRRIYFPSIDLMLDGVSISTYAFVGIFNHNLSSAAVIKVFGADDSAFTTNVVSDTITWAANNIAAFLAAARTKRYIMLDISDLQNPNPYIQVGTVWIGSYWEPEFSYLVQNTSGRSDVSEVSESDARTKFAREKARLKTKYFPFRLTNTDEAIAESFLEEVGLTKAFVICTNQNSPNSSTYLLQNTDLTEPTHNAVNNWSWDITAEEVG